MAFNLYSYMKSLKDEYYQRWGLVGGYENKENSTISKASSTDSVVTKLPSIDDVTKNSRCRKHRSRRRRNTNKGNLGTSLSTSLPDISTASSKPQHPVRFEKLSFSKTIHHELPPAPGASIHPRQPLPPIDAPKPADQDAFNIMNMLDRTVEYYEDPHGHIYITDDGRKPWKEGCGCKHCRKKKADWLTSRKKDEDIKLKKIRNGIKMRDTESSPVKEEVLSNSDEVVH